MPTPVNSTDTSAGHDVGQDLAEQDARRPGAEAAGGEHVLALGEAQRLGPHDPGDRGDRQQRRTTNVMAQVLLTQPNPTPRNSMSLSRSAWDRPTTRAARMIAGKASRASTKIDDHAVDPAAEVAADHAERGADDEADHDAGDGDDQRDAGAVDAAGEHVATEAVGAEPEVVAGTEGVVAGALRRRWSGRRMNGRLSANTARKHEAASQTTPNTGRMRQLAARRDRVGDADGRDGVAAASAVSAVDRVSVRSLSSSRATGRRGCGGRRRRTAGRRSKLAKTTNDGEDGGDRLDDEQVVLLDGEQQAVADALRSEELSRR